MEEPFEGLQQQRNRSLVWKQYSGVMSTCQVDGAFLRAQQVCADTGVCCQITPTDIEASDGQICGVIAYGVDPSWGQQLSCFRPCDSGRGLGASLTGNCHRDFARGLRCGIVGWQDAFWRP